MTRVGISFSTRHAEGLGLDPAAALRRLLRLGFSPVRVSANWDQVAAGGYGTLDAVVAAVEAAGARALVTVGMKAMRWPEFYLPPGIPPHELRGRLLEFVATTVRRYRGCSAVEAWQVENEPLNRSGPEHRMVPVDLLTEEIAAFRTLDERPLVVNGFRHFTVLADRFRSAPRPWTDVNSKVLALLRGGDVLGLDVYPFMPARLGPIGWQSRARKRWPRQTARLRAAAAAAGLRAWVIESQAEPWAESGRDPEKMTTVFRGLEGAGFETILLWGAEHWLWRDGQGDPSWLRVAEALR